MTRSKIQSHAGAVGGDKAPLLCFSVFFHKEQTNQRAGVDIFSLYYTVYRRCVLLIIFLLVISCLNYAWIILRILFLLILARFNLYSMWLSDLRTTGPHLWQLMGINYRIKVQPNKKTVVFKVMLDGKVSCNYLFLHFIASVRR